MKIVELKTTLFEFELDRVMGDANSPRARTKSGSCLVELITDEGLVGISIGGGNSIAQIKSLFEGILVGSDPKAVYSIWKKMVDRFFKGGHDGIANDAITALDVAMWDLRSPGAAAEMRTEPHREFRAAEPRCGRGRIEHPPYTRGCDLIVIVGCGHGRID